MPISNLGRMLRQLQACPSFPLAMLVYVDIRHMRNINRLAEPGAGDRVISETLSVLHRWAGDEGVSGRLWSNEFLAVKVIDNGETAVDEAAALRDQLTNIHYSSLLGDTRIAVALGLVVVNKPRQWRDHIQSAAEACEAAKQRGLNQIVTQAPRVTELHGAQINAAHVLKFRELRHAGRLTLHAQPIMDITGSEPRLARAEFLLRMEKDGAEVPLPAGMIETLEYFGLSTELDSFTTDTALQWLSDNPHVLEQLEGVAINLSARSIIDGRFMSRLFNDVRNQHLPAGKLGFEITETAAIEYLDVAADVIHDFRSIGCSFSLDDFGSGLCSFGYLQTLQVDEVKIDGRFVHDVADNPISQEIVRAINQVAHATGKRTVAEFVDEPRKLTMMKELGVDYAQGWLFHPAVSPERLLALIGSAALRE